MDTSTKNFICKSCGLYASRDKIEELKEAVQHHVEEEENEILPSVSDSMDEQEMKELAKEFKEAKSKLEKETSAAS